MVNLFRKEVGRAEKFAKGEAKEVRGILGRIRRRDFRGNSGVAIKNSVFNFSTAIVSKVGALVFTVILARLLMPELFGLYSLALSTILFFCAFSDLGIGQTMIKILSSKKNDKKRKAYFNYLFRIRIFLIGATVFVLSLSAGIISKYYYQKPIFYALIAGAFYIALSGIVSAFAGLFPAFNNFKNSFYQELIFQTSRIILVSFSILFFVSRASQEILTMTIILMLSASYFIVLIFLILVARRKFSFLKEKGSELSFKEKSFAKSLLISLSFLTVSGTFFGIIDMLVLGRFISGEYIGYYRAALSLVVSAAPLITFSGVLFPLFNRLKGEVLEKGFRKSRKLTIFLGLLAFIGTLIVSRFVVLIIFGTEYTNSIFVLQVLAILLLINPMIALYEAYFISQNKTKVLIRLILISTVLNILLNFLFVISFIRMGQIYGVLGVCFATIISRGFYLFGLGVEKKRIKV